MELFATDLDRLAFLLEADASCYLDDLIARGAELVTEELLPDERPKYITNYIGSKQKLVDWIRKHSKEGVASALDGFCGSAVVAYVYKTKGLRVIANGRLHYSHHAAQGYHREQQRPHIATRTRRAAGRLLQDWRIRPRQLQTL